MNEKRVLASSQVGDFMRDGYVVVCGLYGPREVTCLSTWTEEVASYPEVPGKYMMYFEESPLRPESYRPSATWVVRDLQPAVRR